jgi:hypothetical protein
MAGGAPIGNQNAAKARRWREAIQRALARATGGVDEGLDKIADKLVKAAIDGDQWATDHIADRIDGKATQPVDISTREPVMPDVSDLTDAFIRATGRTPQPPV